MFLSLGRLYQLIYVLIVARWLIGQQVDNRHSVVVYVDDAKMSFTVL